MNPFQAVDGVRFWRGSDALVLRGGLYENGRGAIFVETDGGLLDGKLTVNLVDEEPSDGGFFVLWLELKLRVRTLSSVVWRLDLFEDTGRRLDSGHVKHYAAEWRFAVCDAKAHSGFGGLRVLCVGCTGKIEGTFLREQERRLAADAARRLRGASPRALEVAPRKRALGATERDLGFGAGELIYGEDFE